VARKSLSFSSVSACLARAAVCVVLFSAQLGAWSAETNALSPSPKFLGAESCGSSGCHGGGGHTQNQFIVWSLRDVHHERPFATLTTARSKQIAAALKIANPIEAAECASCHAPLHEIPADLCGPQFRVSEGVSCESCHGPAENWLRSHTRPDYTHAYRVAAGMRDLKDLYVRANTCVACHQTVALPLLNAGHPELIFELDGQSVAEPKHWHEAPASNGSQIWLTGQATDLREICWQIENSPETNKNLLEKCNALIWLLQKIEGSSANLPSLRNVSSADSATVRLAADQFARTAAEITWSPEMTSAILSRLASAAPDFRSKTTPAGQQARRAERLVLALDRLFKTQSSAAAQARLDKLFKLAQSIPDFDSTDFASALDDFSQSIKNP
jgi:hypothetical protein